MANPTDKKVDQQKPESLDTTAVSLAELQSQVANLRTEWESKSKDTTISSTERQAQEEVFRERIDNTRVAIQGQIDRLQGKTDAKSLADIQKAETLLSTLADTLSLQSTIGTTPTSTETKTSSSTTRDVVPTSSSPEAVPVSTTEAQGDEKKGWLRRQWDAFTSKEKWKTETGANLLRAVGVVAVYKGIKGLWNKIRGKKEENENDKKDTKEDKKEDKKNEGGFWEKPLGKAIKGVGIAAGISSGLYYVAHGIWTGNWEIRDMFDRERGKKLDFDDAMGLAEGNIANQSDNKSMSYGIELKYHEDTSEIEAYGQKVKIDKKTRKIDGLNVSFKKYEHLISAAILIAYLKKNYSGKCFDNCPFSASGSWRGNLNVTGQGGKETAANGTGTGGRIVGVSTGALLGIVSGIYGGVKTGATIGISGGIVGLLAGTAIDTNNILHHYMPELDSEYGLGTLCGYLNNLNCWQAKKQQIDDLPETPITDVVAECVKDLNDSNPDSPTRGDRNLIPEVDPSDPTKYIIKAYDREFKAEVMGEGDSRKIKILGISGGNPSIEMNGNKKEVVERFFNMERPLKEGVYLLDLIGFLLKDFSKKGNKYPYFRYSKRAGLFQSGIYFNDKGLDTYALTEESFKKRMGTVFNNKEVFLNFLNDGIVGTDGESIRRDPESYKKKKS